jgi:hypothetical protein
MTALLMNMAEQRSQELRDYASARRLAGRGRLSLRARPATGSLDEISIRGLGPADAAELQQVAGRDSAQAPTGDVLGAERAGRLIAAISIDTGDVVADPFTPTGAARSLLVLRAEQVRRSRAQHGRPARRHGLRQFGARPRRG